MKKFLSCPFDCYDKCSIVVEVSNKNEITSFKGNPHHPYTKGWLCRKGNRILKLLKDPRRINHPSLKTRSGRRVISLKDAINIAAEKIAGTVGKFGGPSVVLVNSGGNTGLLSGFFPKRLFHLLGASATYWNICDSAGEQALLSVFDTTQGIDPEIIPYSDFILIWGFNIAWTSPHMWEMIKEAKRRGCKIILIDPVHTETAEVCDHHLPVQPAQDYTLAFAAAKILLEEFGLEHRYDKKNKQFFEQFASILSDVSLQELSLRCRISLEQIRILSKEFLGAKHPLILVGTGIQRNLKGYTAVKAIAYLQILKNVGSIIFYSNDFFQCDLSILTGPVTGTGKRVSMVRLGRELNSEEFKCMYCYNANPVENFPNSHLIRQAMSSNRIFSIVHELYWGATAEQADLVIPAASLLETNDIHRSYSHKYLSLNQAIKKPGKDRISNFDLTVRLADALQVDEPGLHCSDREWLETILRNSNANCSLDDLERSGFVQLVGSNQLQVSRIKYPVFSGGELREPENSWTHFSQRAFILLTPHHKEQIHSQYLSGNTDFPVILMNVDDARTMDIDPGEKVLMYNDLGKMLVQAVPSNKVIKGVVVFYRKGSSAVNELTVDEEEFHSKGNAVNSTRVGLEKIGSDTKTT